MATRCEGTAPRAARARHPDRSRDDVGAAHGGADRLAHPVRRVRRRSSAGDEVAEPKPHPEAYLRAAELLGVDAGGLRSRSRTRWSGSRRRSRPVRSTIGVPHIVPLPETDEHTLWPTLEGRTVDDLVRARRPAGGRPMSAMRRASAAQSSGPFRAGDRVQLTGPKGKLNTITLEPGKVFHTHRGVLEHDAIIGLPDGSVVTNNVGVEHLALRPLLNDFVMSMPRGAAIIYPKDAAQILALADIFPGRDRRGGRRRLAAPSRSGCCARSGRRARCARSSAATSSPTSPRANVADLPRARPRELVRHGRRPAGCAARRRSGAETVDRVVLDMLAPVGVPGRGHRRAEARRRRCSATSPPSPSCPASPRRSAHPARYTHPQSSETMVRGWHVEGLAVRPDHRMIGHTGFLITARRLAPGAVLPELKRRPSKSDYSDDDVEAWTPGALGERQVSPKSLRKRVRAAAARRRTLRRRATSIGRGDDAADARCGRRVTRTPPPSTSMGCRRPALPAPVDRTERGLVRSASALVRSRRTAGSSPSRRVRPTRTRTATRR